MESLSNRQGLILVQGCVKSKSTSPVFGQVKGAPEKKTMTIEKLRQKQKGMYMSCFRLTSRKFCRHNGSSIQITLTSQLNVEMSTIVILSRV